MVLRLNPTYALALPPALLAEGIDVEEKDKRLVKVMFPT